MNDKTRANNECQLEIAAIREQISRREAEIFAGQRDVQQKTDHAFGIRKEIDAASFELQKNKEERQRDIIELDRIKESVAHRERECLDLSNRNKHLEQEV